MTSFVKLSNVKRCASAAVLNNKTTVTSTIAAAVVAGGSNVLHQPRYHFHNLRQQVFIQPKSITARSLHSLTQSLETKQNVRSRSFASSKSAAAAAATSPSSSTDILKDPLLTSSIIRSLPFLLIRAHACHVEAWLPNADHTSFHLFDKSSYTNKDMAQQLSGFTQDQVESHFSNDGHNLMSQAWQSGACVDFSEINNQVLPQRWRSATSAGLKTGLIVPVLHSHDDKPYALLKFYSQETLKHINQRVTTSENEKDHSDLITFATGIISAGLGRTTPGDQCPVFNTLHDVPKGQIEQVYQRIVREEVFNANLVYHEVDWFYNLGLQKYYFERFTSVEIANHVHAFIAAKKVSATTGRSEDLMLHIDDIDADDKSQSFLYMCATEHSRMVDVEKRIQNQIQKLNTSTGSNKKIPYSFEFFTSDKPILPQGKKKLGLYVLETSTWSNPAVLGKTTESRVEDVASSTFLRTKTPLIRERYQSLLITTTNKISPVAEIYPQYRDGTVPIMFSFFQSAGTTTSYMLLLTELLKSNQLIAVRKFIETFANGVIVFSLYVEDPKDHSKLEHLLKQFSMLHLTPESSLTKFFLAGEQSAEQYTYNSTIARFIYYFLNKRSEEFDVLAKALKNDTLNLGRLRLLQTRLKREAVSQERIYACLTQHAGVVTELFNDFDAKIKNKRQSGMTSKQLDASVESQTMLSKIKNEATTLMDQQILSALLTFNNYILKTNFYNKSKAALSFRFDPSFLVDSDWPQVPFGLYFVMGSDFQGFHIRFKDIARGGIRIIRSSDRQAYNSNLETLYAENFGLAYTQNKKNKDIPEFGSKGTILLNLNNQASPFLAFQKYVSGLLDLMIGSPDIVDNYGKDEILFLGPDEGTADYMEWAAQYAAKRKYSYWRSFTTGKPPSLGGIPHDRFGMTTRSVHRYVLGCLSKLGLKEENVTKFQTGGPDGDLGSNEILLSKDATKSIVDGSGVIYDPQGLNRNELTRLAKKRAMIKEFDVSFLSKDGFKVLISDTNVTLPSGELVVSGVAFRNEFHLSPLSSADLFVPCGGRPESVNLTNVSKMFDSKGLPRFKIIVEGANLFFTQDARLVLENAGVILYKDASANKGGVTSSSLEVLAALALSPQQFEQNMAVKKDVKTGKEVIPQFYKEYVEEIQSRIEADADLEFECIWREHLSSKTHRYLLTDAVSDKINTLNDYVQGSSIWQDVELRNIVLQQAIPKKLLQLVPLKELLHRIPDSYTQAIFGAYLASRYVYKHGLQANEFEFFEFMQPILKQRK